MQTQKLTPCDDEGKDGSSQNSIEVCSQQFEVCSQNSQKSRLMKRCSEKWIWASKTAQEKYFIPWRSLPDWSVLVQSEHLVGRDVIVGEEDRLWFRLVIFFNIFLEDFFFLLVGVYLERCELVSQQSDYDKCS